MAAAGEELLAGVALGLDFGLGLDLAAAGEEDLLGEAEGDAFGLGVGETVFSVVTDTEGSDSRGVGDALSSWANVSEETAKRAARHRAVIFIGFS
jgi:hypothetical protein